MKLLTYLIIFNTIKSIDLIRNKFNVKIKKISKHFENLKC